MPVLGNASGSAYWPPAYDRLPPNDEDPVAVQTFWTRNAAAGLEYVLEHRWALGGSVQQQTPRCICAVGQFAIRCVVGLRLQQWDASAADVRVSACSRACFFAERPHRASCMTLRP